MINLAFRVDGGPQTGMGHIMRSLALAKAFTKDTDISFITKREPSVLNLLEEYRFEIIPIGPNLKHEEEIETVKNLILNNNIDILITDSYEINQDYLIEMKEVVDKLVTIHDFDLFAFPSDIVINGNAYAPDLDYESIKGKTKFLLGTDYTLMREEFQDLPERKINKKVENILVTVGGSDALNLTPKIMTAINQLQTADIHIDVVIGPGFTNVQEIMQEANNSKLEVSLHFNVKKMSELMLRNDLAISAGGSTLYELAATGTPAIALLQAENQVLVAEAMQEANVIINLGFGNQVSVEKLQDKIYDLLDNYEFRKKMSEQGQTIIDGKGAMRCSEFILQEL